MKTKTLPSDQARQVKGWWRSHQWLVLRRLSQAMVLGIFLSGPLFGVWIAQGNLSSSLVLEVLPMTDLLTFLELLASGVVPEVQAVIGFAVVAGLYLLVGGRSFCSWVCPVNLVSDAASWLRGRWGVGRSLAMSRTTRYGVLVVVLLLAAFSGTQVWEQVNPVAFTHRGLIFGMGMGWLVVLGIFLFDLLLAKDGWCGRLCPTGALYSLVTPLTPVRVDAVNREQCDDCMDCFLVCPEPQVIPPALKSGPRGGCSVIQGVACTHCGRCIDVCAKDVYRFTFSIPNRSKVAS